MTKHLGDRIHDLLDGRLDKERTAQALGHIDRCVECAAKWRELVRAREVLNSAEVGIDIAFAQRLLDRERIAQIAATEPEHRARAAVSRGRRWPIYLLGGASFALLGVTALAYSLGSPKAVGLEFVQPGHDPAGTLSIMSPQHMRSGEQLQSWIHPDWETSNLVPVEAKVVQSRSGKPALVATLVRDLDLVQVVERHGRLPDDISVLPKAELAQIDAYVLSPADPAEMIWETGEVVINISCDCPLAALTEVAAEFPTLDQPSFTARLAGGFQEIAETLDFSRP